MAIAIEEFLLKAVNFQAGDTRDQPERELVGGRPRQAVSPPERLVTATRMRLRGSLPR